MSSTSFAIRLDTGTAAQLKDKSYPVVLQIVFQRDGKATKQSMRTGYSCPLKLWDKKYHEFAIEHDDEESLNEELRKIRRSANRIYKEHFKSKNRAFDYSKFVEIFRTREKGETVIGFIDILMQDIIQKKRKLTKKQLSVGTARAFGYIKSVIKNYSDNEEVTFDDIDEDWLINLEQSLRAGGCNDGGIAAYMRSIKSIYGYACDNKIVADEKYPFKGRYSRSGYCFSHLNTKNKRKVDKLTKEEIAKIYRHDVSQWKNAEKYREAIDIFVLSYLTFGTNFEDIVRFQEENICDEEGIKILRYYRKKTINSSAKYTEIPLLPLTLEILNRYRGKSGTKFIFSILKESQEIETLEVKRYLENYLTSIRKRIRRVAKKEGIEKHIIFYTPRYSTGKIAKRAGSTDENVADAYGHTDTRITRKHYIGSTDAIDLVSTIQALAF